MAVQRTSLLFVNTAQFRWTQNIMKFCQLECSQYIVRISLPIFYVVLSCRRMVFFCTLGKGLVRNWAKTAWRRRIWRQWRGLQWLTWPMSIKWRFSMNTITWTSRRSLFGFLGGHGCRSIRVLLENYSTHQCFFLKCLKQKLRIFSRRSLSLSPP